MQFVVLESSEIQLLLLTLGCSQFISSIVAHASSKMNHLQTKLDLDCAKEHQLYLPAVYLKCSSLAHTSDVWPHHQTKTLGSLYSRYCIFSKLYYPALKGSICTCVPIVAIRLELCTVSKVFPPCVGHEFVTVYSRTRGWLLSNIVAAAAPDLIKSDRVVQSSMQLVCGEVLILMLLLH